MWNTWTRNQKGQEGEREVEVAVSDIDTGAVVRGYSTWHVLPKPLPTVLSRPPPSFRDQCGKHSVLLQ